ncbi:MAG: tetratricopeptide repeat protein [Alphaproteobacteria bacterium]|nr:tetratricopeptide repeat protein [Alphaproteobacteria bacterium]
MSNLLIEVDEALKQEKAAKLWKEYGGFLIGTIILIVLGTAALSGYRIWNKSVKITQTESYMEAVDTDDPEMMTKLAASLRPGLKALTLWQAAAAYLEKENKKEALKLYASIQDDKNAPTEFRHLAAYQIARLTAQDDPDTGLVLLEKSANDYNNPWRNLARLDLAVLLAHHKKNYQVAREHLATIINLADLPRSLERKARSLDMLYAILAPETVRKNKAPIPEKQEQPSETQPPESIQEKPEKGEDTP